MTIFVILRSQYGDAQRSRRAVLGAATGRTRRSPTKAAKAAEYMYTPVKSLPRKVYDADARAERVVHSLPCAA